VLTKLDRIGHSLEHLIDLAKDLQACSVDLVVLDQGIDTSTAVGRTFFQILGAIAEFEHALSSNEGSSTSSTRYCYATPTQAARLHRRCLIDLRAS
jgi:hypothetical protein